VAAAGGRDDDRVGPRVPRGVARRVWSTRAAVRRSSAGIRSASDEVREMVPRPRPRRGRAGARVDAGQVDGNARRWCRDQVTVGPAVVAALADAGFVDAPDAGPGRRRGWSPSRMAAGRTERPATAVTLARPGAASWSGPHASRQRGRVGVGGGTYGYAGRQVETGSLTDRAIRRRGGGGATNRSRLVRLAVSGDRTVAASAMPQRATRSQPRALLDLQSQLLRLN
jgi:hypothetical protein